MPKTPNKPREDDVRPDAKRRFEMAVDVALHTRPMHRKAKPTPSRPKRATTKPKKSA
jgi:hypothetical protein